MNSMINIEIIHGRDELFLKEKIDKILKLIPKSFRPFCYLKYFGHTVSDETLLSEVATHPFGCEHKLIVVEEYQKFKNKNLIHHLLKECAATCFLILTSSETKTLGAKLKNMVVQNKQRVNFILLKKLKVEDIQQRITSYLKQHQFQFETAAVAYMAQQLESQPEFLKGELEKLHLFLMSKKGGNEKKIEGEKAKREIFTESLAHSFLSVQDEYSVFKIIDHILTKNKISALRSINAYLNNSVNISGNFVLLQAMLQSEVYKLLKFFELSASGMDEKEIFLTLGIKWQSHQKRMREIIKCSSLFKVHSLLDAVCELERILKSESIVNESRDSFKVNLLGKNWLLKIISAYCQ